MLYNSHDKNETCSKYIKPENIINQINNNSCKGFLTPNIYIERECRLTVNDIEN